MSVPTKPGVNSLDLLIGILTFVADEQKRSEIPCTTPKLQNAIYSLSKQPEFADYFRDYSFQKRGYYHFSEGLLADFRNLERLECISAKNPRFVNYTLHSNVLQRFFNSKYSGEQGDAPVELNILKDMAKAICKNWVDENTGKGS